MVSVFLISTSFPPTSASLRLNRPVTGDWISRSSPLGHLHAILVSVSGAHLSNPYLGSIGGSFSVTPIPTPNKPPHPPTTTPKKKPPHPNPHPPHPKTTTHNPPTNTKRDSIFDSSFHLPPDVIKTGSHLSSLDLFPPSPPLSPPVFLFRVFEGDLHFTSLFPSSWILWLGWSFHLACFSPGLPPPLLCFLKHVFSLLSPTVLDRTLIDQAPPDLFQPGVQGTPPDTFLPQVSPFCTS